MFGHRGREIIIGDLTGDPAQGSEGMHVTADEGLKALAVSELQIEHATVGFHQGEGIELALVAGIIQRAKMPPIDLETLAGRRLHADKGASRLRQRADLLQDDPRACCRYSRRMLWPPV